MKAPACCEGAQQLEPFLQKPLGLFSLKEGKLTAVKERALFLTVVNGRKKINIFLNCCPFCGTWLKQARKS